jgi:uncharacterized protein YdaL
MNSDIKPIIDQIKTQIKGQLTEEKIEQFKVQVSQGMEIGRQIVEAKAKDMLKNSKDSKLVHEYIIPLVESEQVTKALDAVSDTLKLKDTPFMAKILKFRQELIDSKVAQAKVATEVLSDSQDQNSTNETEKQ